MEVFRNRKVNADWLCAHLGEAKMGTKFVILEEPVYVCSNCSHVMLKLEALKAIAYKLDTLIKKMDAHFDKPARIVEDYDFITNPPAPA